MEEPIKANGWIIKCTAKENLHFQMVENMQENMKIIKKKDMVHFTGLIIDNIEESGIKGNSMGKVIT